MQLLLATSLRAPLTQIMHRPGGAATVSGGVFGRIAAGQNNIFWPADRRRAGAA
jgi:hypothetical protein